MAAHSHGAYTARCRRCRHATERRQSSHCLHTPVRLSRVSVCPNWAPSQTNREPRKPLFVGDPEAPATARRLGLRHDTSISTIPSATNQSPHGRALTGSSPRSRIRQPRLELADEKLCTFKTCRLALPRSARKVKTSTWPSKGLSCELKIALEAWRRPSK